ncbi:MAG: molybdopterin-synthase adenylyltransferase MoeB [Alphaproteobacteria bacterium]|nr:molybdopterin-synthase adenylyltransferase MoeB [Alphaproteobacteria bacterium]
MDDAALLRYSRHILLDAVGVEGQQNALNGHALLIGAGGLGSAVALYLAASGVGRMTLVDGDRVELTNLQRQIAHTQDRLGQPKVDSARLAMLALNPGIQVQAISARADAEWLDRWVPQVGVVVDGCDNFETRQRVNAACVQHGVPLVSGSVLGFDGQFSVFDTRRPDSPCYACLFPPDAPPPEVRCATMGVLAPLVGVMGTLQATEALKILMGLSSDVPGRLLMLDGQRLQWTELRLGRAPDCLVCAQRP